MKNNIETERSKIFPWNGHIEPKINLVDPFWWQYYIHKNNGIVVIRKEDIERCDYTIGINTTPLINFNLSELQQTEKIYPALGRTYSGWVSVVTLVNIN